MKYNNALKFIAICLSLASKLIAMEYNFKGYSNFNFCNINKDGPDTASDEGSSDEESARRAFRYDEELQNKKTNTNTEAKSFERKAMFSFKDFVDGVPHEVLDIVCTLNNLNNETYINDIKGNEIYSIILYGPPGTGKTSMAEAIAKETGRKFYCISSSAIVTKFQGSGSETIRKIIKHIKNAGIPSVVFIDEVDGISNNQPGNSNNTENNNAIYALHDEMNNLDPNIFYVFATNHLDKLTIGLKGRSICVEVKLPETFCREKLLNRYACKRVLKVNPNFFNELSMFLEGYSCRDIKLLSKYAYNLAFRESTSAENLQVTEMHYKIALAMLNSCPIHDKIDSLNLFKYYIKQFNAELDKNIDFQRIGSELEGLSGTQIRDAVKTAVDLLEDRQGDNVTTLDLCVGIYYNQKTKFASSQMRELILAYFLGSTKTSFKNNFISEITKYLADDFTGLELKKIIFNAKYRAKSQNCDTVSEEDFYVGMCQELIKKARPFEIVKTVYTEIKNSLNLSGNLAFLSFSFPFDIAKHRKTEEYKEIKNVEDFLRVKTIGDLINTQKRLDYRTKVDPDQSARVILIKYFLKKYTHNLTENEIAAFAQKANLSWYSLKKCIEEAHDLTTQSSCRQLSYNHIKYILICQYDILFEENIKQFEGNIKQNESADKAKSNDNKQEHGFFNMFFENNNKEKNTENESSNCLIC